MPDLIGHLMSYRAKRVYLTEILSAYGLGMTKMVSCPT